MPQTLLNPSVKKTTISALPAAPKYGRNLSTVYSGPRNGKFDHIITNGATKKIMIINEHSLKRLILRRNS